MPTNMEFSLIIPAFIAGILIFLAPCTLPLLPAYLCFISGVSASDLKDPSKLKIVRGKIFLNGVFYVIGFVGVIFIIFGIIYSIGGTLIAEYRFWLSRIGGIFVIFFGLYMMGIFKLPFLNVEKHIVSVKALKPGNPASSLAFGAAFAFGWSPCVSPILGSILAFIASSATTGQGVFLLGVFSIGLAMPFLIIAASIGSASLYIRKLSKHLNAVSIISGLFLVFLGALLLTNNLGIWVSYFYKIFIF